MAPAAANRIQTLVWDPRRAAERRYKQVPSKRNRPRSEAIDGVLTIGMATAQLSPPFSRIQVRARSMFQSYKHVEAARERRFISSRIVNRPFGIVGGKLGSSPIGKGADRSEYAKFEAPGVRDGKEGHPPFPVQERPAPPSLLPVGHGN